MDPSAILTYNHSDPDWFFVADDGQPVADLDRPLRVTGATGAAADRRAAGPAAAGRQHALAVGLHARRRA